MEFLFTKILYGPNFMDLLYIFFNGSKIKSNKIAYNYLILCLFRPYGKKMLRCVRHPSNYGAKKRFCNKMFFPQFLKFFLKVFKKFFFMNCLPQPRYWTYENATW